MKFIDTFKELIGKLSTKNDNTIIDLEDLDIDEREEYVNQLKLSPNLDENLAQIKELFGDSIDLNIRRFKIGSKDLSGALIYMSGLINGGAVEKILETLEIELSKIKLPSNTKRDIYENISSDILDNKKIDETEEFSELLNNVTMGSTAILFEGISQAILCETKGFETRSVEEPDAEYVIRGPREGFVESIFVNTSLLRRRIRGPHLWFQSLEIGSLSKTQVAVAYIKGLASEELVEEVKSRLKAIDIDNVLDSGVLQEYLKDQPFTVFPLMQSTERPDRVTSCLAEGKVAVLVDGSPFVINLPTNLSMFLQSPDDYYESFLFGSFVRFFRYISFSISLLLPGIYVAIVNFHQELIPIDLFLKITSTREGVPFPIIVEALLMQIIFEILREAGLRLPKAIGQAVSIVGALVLGEAAINAGLVSPPMVIVVALTGIATFTNPSFPLAAAARMLRFAFLLLGATIGLFGIQFGILLLLIHLCALRSFGQPYFQPFGPLIWQDLKDAMVRLYWWKMPTRPKLPGGREPQRQPQGQKPEPPEEKEGE